jgi:hypothetical protein
MIYPSPAVRHPFLFYFDKRSKRSFEAFDGLFSGREGLLNFLNEEKGRVQKLVWKAREALVPDTVAVQSYLALDLPNSMSAVAADPIRDFVEIAKYAISFIPRYLQPYTELRIPRLGHRSFFHPYSVPLIHLDGRMKLIRMIFEKGDQKCIRI